MKNRMRALLPGLETDAAMVRLYEERMQPVLVEWLEENPERAAALSEDERDELFSLFGTGGPLTTAGVEHFVQVIERRRAVLEKVMMLAGAEGNLEFFEDMVAFLMEQSQVSRQLAVGNGQGSE